MKIMVGIDLHSNNALCGLMDESGRRLVHKKLPCDLPTILQLLEPYKERIATVAIESTYNWYWLVDGLQDHGYHVALANPARMQPYSGMKYTDDVSDAYFLTELLRLKLLPTGHLYDRQTRPVRDLLRRRLLLVRQRTTLILSFKSLNERTLGQRVPLARVKAMKAEEAQARFTDPADQLLSGQQITLMGQPTDAITKLEQHILGVAGQWPTYQRLQGLPGIGKILGLTIALETGPAKRFADAGNFASYCRCVKSLRTSNRKKKGENNRKCGNKYLAWAFVEAAHFACRYDEQCRRFYDRKKQQTNPVIATKALACKLAKAAWHVMAADVPYDASRVFGPAKKSNLGETDLFNGQKPTQQVERDGRQIWALGSMRFTDTYTEPVRVVKVREVRERWTNKHCVGRTYALCNCSAGRAMFGRMRHGTHPIKCMTHALPIAPEMNNE